MAAAAARSASARSSAAPARRPATRRASQASRPRTAPGPVGRTAVAMGGVAEWGLVHRLTRGRLWIGVLATLLVGIVAINVMALNFSAASSKTASNADELKRVNSSLRAQIAGGLSTDRMQRKAQESGLEVPNPGSIRYLRTKGADAATAAKRLTDGSITVAGADAVVPSTETTVDPAVSDPALATPVVTDPAIDPVTGEPLTP